jgi:ferritin-like metal-binding protein YciE
MAEKGGEPVLDAALIAAAQKVEHYEIAAYGCLITYAGLLDETEIRRLLEQTLAEEEATDKALTALGEAGINQAAMAAGTVEDE